MLEVVAGIDDDGELARPADAPDRATAWRRRCRRTGPHRRRLSRAHRNRSSALGRDQRGRRAARRAPVESAHQRGRPRLGRFAHGQHGGGGDRVGKSDLGHLQRRGPTGPSRRAGPTATARRRRRWRARPCRAATPGRRCRRRSRRCRLRKCASSRSLRRRALSSGACGSSSTRRPWSSAPRFDWSMPALAMTKPCRVATISTFGLARITSVASDRIASTSRASFLVICASSRARSLGSMPPRSRYRPSALETIFSSPPARRARAGRCRSPPAPRSAGRPDHPRAPPAECRRAPGW